MTRGFSLVKQDEPSVRLAWCELWVCLVERSRTNTNTDQHIPRVRPAGLSGHVSKARGSPGLDLRICLIDQVRHMVLTGSRGCKRMLTRA